MNTTVVYDRKICIWRSGEKRFSVSLDFLVGMATLKKVLPDGQNEVLGSDLAGINLPFLKVKMVEDLSDPTLNSVFIKLLVLQATDYIVATKIDELIYYGAEQGWKHNETDNIFKVTEQHILELGNKGEKQELSATTKDNSREPQNFIFFKLGPNNFAIDVDDVAEVVSARQAVEYKLVSNRAVGYIHSKGETIPILSIDGTDLRCEKIIVTVHDNTKFGFPVNAITNLIRDFDRSTSSESANTILYAGEQWSVFDAAASLKNVNLKEIQAGYENIFSLGQQRLKSQDSSVLKSLVLMDIGEKVCISAELIRKIEPVRNDFDPEQSTFSYNELSLPLVDARKHYGLKKNEDKKTIERILILEKENTLVSVLVSSVDAIVYIDQKSVSAYGEWIFREANANFKKDVAGMIHVLDYQHKDKMNLVKISFDTIFETIKKVS